MCTWVCVHAGVCVLVLGLFAAPEVGVRAGRVSPPRWLYLCELQWSLLNSSLIPHAATGCSEVLPLLSAASLFQL